MVNDQPQPAENPTQPTGARAQGTYTRKEGSARPTGLSIRHPCIKGATSTQTRHRPCTTTEAPTNHGSTCSSARTPGQWGRTVEGMEECLQRERAHGEPKERAIRSSLKFEPPLFLLTMPMITAKICRNHKPLAAGRAFGRWACVWFEAGVCDGTYRRRNRAFQGLEVLAQPRVICKMTIAICVFYPHPRGPTGSPEQGCHLRAHAPFSEIAAPMLASILSTHWLIALRAGRAFPCAGSQFSKSNQGVRVRTP